MFRNFVTGINYEKLIRMQANQESFAPHAISRKAQLKIENRKAMAKVNTSGVFPTRKRKHKNKPKVKVLTRESKDELLQKLGGGSKNVQC